MSEDTNNTPDKGKKSEELKHAICYAPFGAIVMFFVENTKSDILKKHIKYGFILFVIYAFLNILSFGFLTGMLFIVYVLIAMFLGIKAYNGEEVKIDYIDKMEQKIREKL